MLGAETLEGYSEDRRIELLNPTHEDLDKFCDYLPREIVRINKVADSEGRTETMVVFVYFAGHGTQDGYNYVLLNEEGHPDGTGVPANKVQS